MEVLGAIFEWIGTNESVLSGIAATIVILGVLYTPFRRLLRTGRSSREEASESTDASATAAALPLITDRPSIAVMPFVNLSGDSEQEFLADGLTEDIILGLSRMRQLFVVARGSCFTYKGRTVDAQQVSRELGVRYVLEGSIRKGGNRIRVTAQLVDATTRTPVWAEHFDRLLEEILEVDDEVTDAIVAALQPALRRAEAEHARRSEPEDLTAWGLVNRAWVTVQSDLADPESAEAAIRACEEALALDPEYAFGHAVLAHAKSLLVSQRDPNPMEQGASALTSIRRALELDPDDPLVHHCHGALLGNLGRTADGIGAWERAIELDANNAGARAGLGIAKIFMRQADQALEPIETALRLSPRDPLVYHWLGNRALALALTGRIDEAGEAATTSLQRKPSQVALAVLAAARAHQDRIVEAAEAWRELVDRVGEQDAQDTARLASALAPDESWGQIVGKALRKAAASAGEGSSIAVDAR
jgi:adenylate cyclase